MKISLESATRIPSSESPAPAARGLSFRQIVSVDDCVDVEGRPLTEHRASAEILGATTMELKACPYQDSRHNHERHMNVSALKQLSTHWDASLALIQAFRTCFAERLGHPPQRAVEHLRVADAIASIPAWLMHRPVAPIAPDALPADVAAVYKIIIGLHRLMQVQLSGEMMSRGTDRPLRFKSHDIAQYADMGGFLIGSEQVCAGSPMQIERAIEATMFGTIDLPDADEQLQNILGQQETFFDFAEHLFRYNCAQFATRSAMTIALSRIRMAVPETKRNFIQSAIAWGLGATAGGNCRRASLPGVSSLRVAVLETPNDRLRARIDAAIRETDAAGTLRQFADTRSPDQLEKLINGWCQLTADELPQIDATPDPASAAHAEQLETLLSSAGYCPELATAIQTEAAAYGRIDAFLDAMLEDNQAAVNAMLGRPFTPEPEEDSRLTHILFDSGSSCPFHRS